MASLARRIFREYDIRGIAGVDLTVDVARRVGAAYAAYLTGRGVERRPIAVGRDNRPSGEELQPALIDGLRAGGLDVIDLGVVPTPAVYWSAHNLPVAGAIQVTGSHNPKEYNGFKLGLGKGSIWGPEIQRLYEIAAGDLPAAPRRGALTTQDVIPAYLDDIVARVGRLSRPLRVVLDCGNGAGSGPGPRLLERLGCELHCLYCESDGTFPNHHPDPTVPENLRDLVAEVAERRADVGIAFDGDADRIGVIAENGEIVWGDQLLILYARDVLRRTGAGQPIIFDVKCSQALPDAIAKAGGRPLMWRTGHSLIEEKMHETHAPIAGEMSGHMFFAEGWYGFDDALLAAARLLRIVADEGRGVAAQLADVPRFVATPEIRVDCPDETKFEIVRRAVAHFKRGREVIDVDGARVLFGDGWGLIRASNTQPVLVLRFEARSEARLREIEGEFTEWLRAQGVEASAAAH
ncbi:MAG: phosphomannomutase/phosphoglucomutase [Gemmatimonadaceae bacterium]